MMRGSYAQAHAGACHCELCKARRPLKMPKTKRGANKQANALLRAYQRQFAGGGVFGWDYPTWRMNQPEVMAHIDAIRAIYKELPQS